MTGLVRVERFVDQLRRVLAGHGSRECKCARTKVRPFEAVCPCTCAEVSAGPVEPAIVKRLTVLNFLAACKPV